jgi:pyruvate,orthophosphate dikinase
MTKYVYDFAEGSRDMADLLGGKGANLAEMSRMGIPVPPGFTITTDACKTYLSLGTEPEEMAVQVADALERVEDNVGRKFGDPVDPLLVAVRSGAKFSMPGMMETVLDIGLNDRTVLGLAAATGNERFAWDSYRRLIQMYGRTVMDVDAHLFEDAIDKAKSDAGAASDVDLSLDNLRGLVANYKQIVQTSTGREFPQDPREQLQGAILAVFNSWNTERARLYRRQEHIPEDLGTAVNVVTMVFGNLGESSGTGVAFTRDPATGAPGTYGDWLENAQGEDVVAGIRNTQTLEDLYNSAPEVHGQLMHIMGRLEEHYRDLCDIEFTVERGRLWMLQTRVGKRTPGAAFRIATQLVDEGRISMDEALVRVTGQQLAHLMFPSFDPAAERVLLAKGVAASPGAAVGRLVFDSHTAIERAEQGWKVVLARRETNPDDLGGMVASEAILTSRGGKTSHAAVVARGMGKTCVCGAEDLDIDTVAGRLTTPDGTMLLEGDTVSIDGSTGQIFAGEVPVVPSPVARYFEGDLAADHEDADDLVRAVHRMVEHADSVRSLGVRANADTPEDAARARRMGASGIGLCRTEHMFLGERKRLVEDLILAENDEQREAVYEELLPMQRQDFVEILEAMDGLPVVIRLLDPPLHEFLPDRTELAVRVALAEERGESDEGDLRLLHAVERMREQNPMLGLRGVRLGLVLPGLFALQIQALAEAACQQRRAGRHPKPEVMVPLVGSAAELDIIKVEVARVLDNVANTTGCRFDIPVGTMIELPRAALTTDRIARHAQFFSFGTNDLTQTTWGFSRDDVEGGFFSTYLEHGVFPVSPFETIDVQGVGKLVEMAAAMGREVRPGMSLGVCGEHGGDPASIHFFDAVPLDYVSCSPFRVPVARLEAGRATLMREGVNKSDSR